MCWSNSSETKKPQPVQWNILSILVLLQWHSDLGLAHSAKILPYDWLDPVRSRDLTLLLTVGPNDWDSYQKKHFLPFCVTHAFPFFWKLFTWKGVLGAIISVLITHTWHNRPSYFSYCYLSGTVYLSWIAERLATSYPRGRLLLLILLFALPTSHRILFGLNCYLQWSTAPWVSVGVMVKANMIAWLFHWLTLPVLNFPPWRWIQPFKRRLRHPCPPYCFVAMRNHHRF